MCEYYVICTIFTINVPSLHKQEHSHILSIFPMFLIYFSYISLIFNFCDHDIVFDIDLKTVTNDRLVGFGGNISFVLTHS